MINWETLQIKIIDFDSAQILNEVETYVGKFGLVPYSIESKEVLQLGCLLYHLYFREDFPSNMVRIHGSVKELITRKSNSIRKISIRNHDFLAQMLIVDENTLVTIFQIWDFTGGHYNTS
jgi:hypothetical protein